MTPEAGAALVLASLALGCALRCRREPGARWIALAVGAPLAADLLQLAPLPERAALAAWVALRFLGTLGAIIPLTAATPLRMATWGALAAVGAAWCALAPHPSTWWAYVVAGAPIVGALGEACAAATWRLGGATLDAPRRAALVLTAGDLSAACLALALPRAWPALAILAGVTSGAVAAALLAGSSPEAPPDRPL